MTNVIKPTIGRKLYYNHGGDQTVNVMDPSQPIDATIIYVHPENAAAPDQYFLNLYVVDHGGVAQLKSHVPLIQGDAVADSNIPHAYWMPYQLGQAAKTDAVEAQAALQQQLSTTSPESNPNAGQDVSAQMPQSTSADVAQTAAQAPAPTIVEAYSSDFSGALSALKAGKAVTRKAWNANSAQLPDSNFVYMVPAASYPAQTDIAKKTFGEGGMVPYHAYLAMRRADGTVLVFNPGIDSILASDWQVLDI
jgi:hypothetical protein